MHLEKSRGVDALKVCCRDVAGNGVGEMETSVYVVNAMEGWMAARDLSRSDPVENVLL